MSDIKGVTDIKFEPNKRFFTIVRLIFIGYSALFHINLWIFTFKGVRYFIFVPNQASYYKSYR